MSDNKKHIDVNLDNENFENDIISSAKSINLVKKEISKTIVWQEELIESLIIGLLWEWHILLEWVPWLAKTLTVNTLSKTLDLWFNRVQFTPDLLPSDLVWTEIYNSHKSKFEIKKWPIFNNFILADEINRAPSKVQSALLEAMAEKHITIWNDTFKLDKPFIVLATQNPIEQSGTYKLPEAQLDRFMMRVKVDYPSYEDEKEMYKKVLSTHQEKLDKVLHKDDILKIQKLVKKVFISESIITYVTNIVDSSRNPEKYDLSEIKDYITYWLSPRAWISLLTAAKVRALMQKRSYVLPDDIKYLAKNILSHRLVLSYEAIANDIDEYRLVEKILSKIEVI